jgi:hypothetical protein
MKGILFKRLWCVIYINWNLQLLKLIKKTVIQKECKLNEVKEQKI